MNESPSPELPEDFATLLQLAGKGDRQAQEAICQKYETQVRIVARVLLGPLLRPYLDTADVMQSVHRSLLVGLRDDKFDIASPDKLVALACTIVRRKVARKWRIHRHQSRFDNPERSGDLFNTLSSLSNSSDDPSKVAEYKDSVAKLYEELTDIERRMLERRLDGYTTGEVADELGIPHVAIRVRWSRLRKRLESAGVVADWI